jgi:hypothetical protein
MRKRSLRHLVTNATATSFTIAIPDDIERPQGFFRVLMQ